jgi:hypothetical protein
MGYLAGLFLLSSGYWLGMLVAHAAGDSVPPMPGVCLCFCLASACLAWAAAPRQKDP